MKRIILTLTAGFIGLCSYAQTAYDALLFSGNEYEGTARTMAMGNAFTALGGDLGSIGINPAGSAVAKYSQVTFTPALTFTTSTTQGVSPFSDGSLPYFERKMKNTSTRFDMPNVGVTLDINTGRKSGIKNITFGFIANRTASWNEDSYASGMNKTTSYMASMAYWATQNGLTGTELNAQNAYDSMPWRDVVGFQSGMISTFGGRDDQFVGASEVVYDSGEISIGGPLDQSYGRRVRGGKYDGALNVGINISDFIYLGANLGITSIDYGYKEYFKETAQNPSDFKIGLANGETIYFNDMRYQYEYSAEGMGYFGKIGVIVTPGGGLRIGAAIQTPTLTTVREGWQQSGETRYDRNSFNASAKSPYGEGSYKVVSPYRANFGIAYALGRFGVISADYELCDFSTMKYKTNNYDWEYFEGVNNEIKELFRTSHAFRAGLEIKPIAELAVRAGYGLTTSPEAHAKSSALQSQNISLGLGYSSKNSFFADLAVRRSLLADEYIMPYADYMYDEDGQITNGAYAPEILNKKGLWKVALTLGWRF